MSHAPPENALTDVRVEYVEETTPGSPPTDPAWQTPSDYYATVPSWSGDSAVEGENVVGSGDLADHFRGPEDHTLELEYWLQEALVDGSGNAQNPLAIPMVHDYQTGWPTHTVVVRREVTSGGADGAGYREYIVAYGARATASSLPGDPSEGNPVVGGLTYEAELTRQYIVHQPSASTTLDVVSTSDNDTMDVTIENEDAGTTETVTLNGTTTVTTTATFGDIDAIYVSSEPEGDIQVSDGSGTDFLERPIAGSNTDGVEGHQGIPLLGSGSHASAIGNDPADYQFLGTSSSWSGGDIADGDRVHALDLTVEADVTKEAQQGTRRQAIDVGPRTGQAEVDVAGPYESAVQNARYYRTESGDLVYGFPTFDITLKNATLIDTDDVERSAGDANNLYGVTFEGDGDPAITVSQV